MRARCPRVLPALRRARGRVLRRDLARLRAATHSGAAGCGRRLTLTPRVVTATFRFYEELNDFLAPERRRREFTVPCARAATTKHMIEALGVPHTEVELVLVNGESVGFDRILEHGDRVAVFPKFEMVDVTPLLRIREHPLRITRFIADAHLGGLAHLLRMTGFDTLYDNNYHDRQIELLAAQERRIVLTRDRELL